MDKVTGQCPQTTTFFEEKGERKRYRTEVLPLTSLTPYREAKPAHWGLKKVEKVNKKNKKLQPKVQAYDPLHFSNGAHQPVRGESMRQCAPWRKADAQSGVSWQRG